MASRPVTPWPRWAALLGLIFAGGAAPPEPKAPGAPATTWLSAQQLRQRHDVSLSWQQMPLGRGLANLAHSQHVAILLDRRVDPDATLDLELHDVALLDGLRQIATSGGLGTSLVGAVEYVGPTDVARRLATVAALRTADVQRLPRERAAQLLAKKPLRYPDLATPREVVQALGDECHAAIEGLNHLPHDLLRGVDLPPLTWVERMTLVLCQFDLSFAGDPQGRSVQLVPLPERPRIERSYAAGSEAEARRKRWQELAPEAEIELRGGRIVVRGRFEDHERLSFAARPAPAKPTGTTTAYTLTARNVELAKFLAHLEQRLKLHFDVDRDALAAAGVSLEQMVTVEVREATLDALLRATFDPLGLSFAIDGAEVRVSAAPKQPAN